MARPKKVLVEANPTKSEPVDIKNSENLIPKEPIDKRKVEVLKYIKLIEIVKNSKDKKSQDLAFGEIVKMLEPKINQISYKFNIPGFSKNDIYQESLIALRFKAIKDYNPNKSNIANQLSPFDYFAALCINRHLSTKLKSSYQNKNKVLNVSISLDQNRDDNSNGNMDGNLFLSDIVQNNKIKKKEEDKDILTKINVREYRNTLFCKLFQKLSVFEKEVFLLYAQGHSYEEMAGKISGGKKKNKEKLKSIDNALSRLKKKAESIFDKYGEKHE